MLKKHHRNLKPSESHSDGHIFAFLLMLFVHMMTKGIEKAPSIEKNNNNPSKNYPIFGVRLENP